MSKENNLRIYNAEVRVYKNTDTQDIEIWINESGELNIWRKPRKITFDKSGYEFVYVNNVPVCVHRILMAWICGWKSIWIGKDYEIHHLNRNKQDNNIGNLICLPATEHHRLHHLLWELEQLVVNSNVWRDVKGEIDKIINKAVLLRERCMKKRKREFILRSNHTYVV